MIEQTSGLGSALVAEQLLRTNNTNETAEQQPQNVEERGGQEQTQATDTVSLSSEAVALAATVQPTEESPDVSAAAQVEQGGEIFAEQQVQQAEEQRAGTIDIRV